MGMFRCVFLCGWGTAGRSTECSRRCGEGIACRRCGGGCVVVPRPYPDGRWCSAGCGHTPVVVAEVACAVGGSPRATEEGACGRGRWSRVVDRCVTASLKLFRPWFWPPMEWFLAQFTAGAGCVGVAVCAKALLGREVCKDRLIGSIGCCSSLAGQAVCCELPRRGRCRRRGQSVLLTSLADVLVRAEAFRSRVWLDVTIDRRSCSVCLVPLSVSS